MATAMHLGQEVRELGVKASKLQEAQRAPGYDLLHDTVRRQVEETLRTTRARRIQALVELNATYRTLGPPDAYWEQENLDEGNASRLTILVDDINTRVGDVHTLVSTLQATPLPQPSLADSSVEEYADATMADLRERLQAFANDAKALEDTVIHARTFTQTRLQEHADSWLGSVSGMGLRETLQTVHKQAQEVVNEAEVISDAFRDFRLEDAAADSVIASLLPLRSDLGSLRVELERVGLTRRKSTSLYMLMSPHSSTRHRPDYTVWL
jgi:phage protein D